MFKVTFAFEDGSVVETYANAGIIYWKSHVRRMWRLMRHVPEMHPAENAGCS